MSGELTTDAKRVKWLRQLSGNLILSIVAEFTARLPI
jgi:hypothetical protein